MKGVRAHMPDIRVELHLFDQTDGKYHDVTFGDNATMYVCGVTPYDASHLGHTATFLYFDILRRLLMSHGVNVVMARNVTDLDDPLFERARTSGEPVEEIVRRNIENLDADLAELNIITPEFEPYSSEYVNGIIDSINKLLADGHAYSVDGWTYFDISTRETFPEFETIRALDETQRESIAAERGADLDDARKRNRLDFILWKPSAEDEPSYDAPFGAGRPGWHIECSVMASSLLGNTIDIHGGGDDLIFPHHACEVCQSETLTGKKFVRHFVHVAPVAYDGEKMSKSLGNLVYASEVIHDIGPMCTRMMILSHHYREGFEHHDADARAAQNRCSRWGEVLKNYDGVPVSGEVYGLVQAALADDLDTPKALAIIDEAVSQAEENCTDELASDILSAKELLGL
jgi:L-cysteine:1D-myo-inositol 2-amino-2-deoxy-alpha-D-glucopyranoside ligase